MDTRPRCETCGRELPRARREQDDDGPQGTRAARRSLKMIRRSMEADDGLGYVPTRIAVRMGRRFTPAA